MTQPAVFKQEVLDQNIRALQDWLRSAWLQLADPALTAFSRRELRNQMKQCSADLRAHLRAAAERPPEPVAAVSRTFSKPEFRLLTELSPRVVPADTFPHQAEQIGSAAPILELI